MRLNLNILALVSLAAAVILPMLTATLRAQQVSRMEANAFKVQLETYPPPHETQIKTLLEGRHVDPQPGGLIVCTEPRLTRFDTNGAMELEVRSPQCVFNVMQRTISSSNVLQVEMANGRFFTQATGFLRTTNNTIILSNQVHTVIRVPMRRSTQP
jgi:hypothetical protein